MKSQGRGRAMSYVQKRDGQKLSGAVESDLYEFAV